MRGHVSQRVGTEQVTPTKLGVFCRMEVYEKTARPRTFSPGDFRETVENGPSPELMFLPVAVILMFIAGAPMVGS